MIMFACLLTTTENNIIRANAIHIITLHYLKFQLRDCRAPRLCAGRS